jgi:hypothetical protein
VADGAPGRLDFQGLVLDSLFDAPPSHKAAEYRQLDPGAQVGNRDVVPFLLDRNTTQG